MALIDTPGKQMHTTRRAEEQQWFNESLQMPNHVPYFPLLYFYIGIWKFAPI